MKIKYNNCLTIIFLVLCFHINAQSQQDSILNRYRQYLFRNERVGKVDQWLNTLNDKHQWADVDYNDIEPAKWKVSNHLSRVRSLAMAWANPQSTHFHSENVWKTISPALDHWLEKRYKSSNWWHNQIGVPQIMRDIIILTRDKMTPDQLKQSLEVLNQHKVTGTGGNLVWSADLGIHYTALMKDTALLRKYSELLIKEIKVSTDEGVQPDYSFHQHGLRLEIYQYGKAFLTNGVRLAWQLRGTPWAFPEEKTDILADFVTQGWQWMARGRNTVPGTIDRAVSRPNELQGADLREVIPFLCELSPKNAPALKEIAQRMNGKGSLSGFKYFPYSDFAAYHRKNFSFFLKTISTRTLASESINHENLKGRLLDNGDGYLIKNGQEYFNLLPAWDWEMLPGITNFTGKSKIERKNFSGSVSDKVTGLTAMEYSVVEAENNKSLTAHKIWVCKDDLVVCLISDIRGQNIQGDVFTALDQCRWQGDVTVNESSNVLKEGNNQLKKVRWIHHNSFAYIPVKPLDIDVCLNTITGTWNAINTSQSKAPVTEKVFKPVLIHHLNDWGAESSGYVLADCKTTQDAEKLVNNPTWKILSNDKDCQAVSFKDNTLTISFFTAGALKVGKSELTTDKPCLILISSGKLYVSDPNHIGGKTTIVFKGKKMVIDVPENGTTSKGVPFELGN